MNEARIFSVLSVPWATYWNPQMEWSRTRTWRVPLLFRPCPVVHAFHQWHVIASLPLWKHFLVSVENGGTLCSLRLELFAERKRRKIIGQVKVISFICLDFIDYFFIHQKSKYQSCSFHCCSLLSMFAWPYITIMTHISFLCTAQYQSMKKEIERLKMVSMKLPTSLGSSYFHVDPTEPGPSEPSWQMLDMGKLSLGGNPVPLKHGFKS